jgi:hypothetical protein
MDTYSKFPTPGRRQWAESPDGGMTLGPLYFDDEDLVGPATEQERVCAPVDLVHGGTGFVVEVSPAAALVDQRSVASDGSSPVAERHSSSTS